MARNFNVCKLPVPCVECGTLGGWRAGHDRKPYRAKGRCKLHDNRGRTAGSLDDDESDRNWLPTPEQIKAAAEAIRNDPDRRPACEYEGRGHDYRVYSVHIPAPMTRGI